VPSGKAALSESLGGGRVVGGYVEVPSGKSALIESFGGGRVVGGYVEVPSASITGTAEIVAEFELLQVPNATAAAAHNIHPVIFRFILGSFALRHPLGLAAT
jgi:hypothetical protein